MSTETLEARSGSGPFSPESTAKPYQTLRERHLRDMCAAMPAALTRLGWPAEQLKAERTTRLRHLLDFTKNHSPWHRERLKHVDPQTFTEERLGDLPVMNKDDVMAHFNEIDRRLSLDLAESHLGGLRRDAYLLDRYHVNASGGSSGRRGVVVHDWDGWTAGFLGFARHLTRLLEAQGAASPFIGAVVASRIGPASTEPCGPPFAVDQPSKVIAARTPYDAMARTSRIPTINSPVLMTMPSALPCSTL